MNEELERLIDIREQEEKEGKEGKDLAKIGALKYILSSSLTPYQIEILGIHVTPEGIYFKYREKYIITLTKNIDTWVIRLGTTVMSSNTRSLWQTILLFLVKFREDEND